MDEKYAEPVTLSQTGWDSVQDCAVARDPVLVRSRGANLGRGKNAFVFKRSADHLAWPAAFYTVKNIPARCLGYQHLLAELNQISIIRFQGESGGRELPTNLNRADSGPLPVHRPVGLSILVSLTIFSQSADAEAMAGHGPLLSPPAGPGEIT